MSNPIVAIIGRANVGKSTLLNRLVGKRLAITEDLPGTTRDRIFAPIKWGERYFTMVDTGGMEPVPEGDFSPQINLQVEAALNDADLIIFMVDLKDGITTIDREIADILRKASKEVILVANKADNDKLAAQVAEFYELGIGEPLVISAYHGKGIADLMEKTISLLPADTTPEEGEPLIKIAIIGRANVGKSTLLNALLGKDRAIVSEIPGTTRDSIDTTLECQGEALLLIDTAGIRKRGKIERGVEKYSVMRSLKAIERADIVVLVIDASEGITAQDVHVAGYAYQEAKGFIVVVNKCDLCEGLSPTDFSVIIKSRFKFLTFAPIEYTQASLGKGIANILPEAIIIYKQRQKRIPTTEVNSMIKQVSAKHSPPHRGSKQLKLLYATQAEVNPPTFVLFVNDATLMHFSYRRFLENKLRLGFGFDKTPLRLIFKSRGENANR
jgi:GTP-binding protein